MIKSLFNEYKSFTGFRFLVAGMINTLFGFTLSILLLVTLPFHYAFTLFLSTVLAVCFNYYMSLKFVFQTKCDTFINEG